MADKPAPQEPQHDQLAADEPRPNSGNLYVGSSRADVHLTEDLLEVAARIVVAQEKQNGRETASDEIRLLAGRSEVKGRSGPRWYDLRRRLGTPDDAG